MQCFGLAAPCSEPCVHLECIFAGIGCEMSWPLGLGKLCYCDKAKWNSLINICRNFQAEFLMTLTFQIVLMIKQHILSLIDNTIFRSRLTGGGFSIQSSKELVKYDMPNRT